MNVFDEFIEIAESLEKHAINYALIGGVAMAFHAEPRYTQDIDVLVEETALVKINELLKNRGYYEPVEPMVFKKTGLLLYRYTKAVGEDLLIIDILVAGVQRHKDIIEHALHAESETTMIKVAQKKDLIWLKKQRNTKQDQVDIERLLHEED